MKILLEEALNSVVAGPSRRDEVWTFLSETPIPEAERSGHREGCRHDMSKTLKQGGVSHSECLEFLCTKGPTFMTRSLDDKHEISNLLLTMADNVMTANQASAAPEPPTWDMLEMSMWYLSLSELIKEMKMVQEQYPSVMDNSTGVYVISSAPYDAFLRAMAAEVADRFG